MTKPRPAPIEAGAVETEMRTGDMPDVPGEDAPNGASIEDAQLAPEPMEPEPMPTEAALTGPEMAEIRVRNDAVDRANKDAAATQEEATQKARLAQYAQEALTGGVTNLIMSKGLDPNYRYQVDMERGRIVNRGRFLPPPQMLRE